VCSSGSSDPNVNIGGRERERALCFSALLLATEFIPAFRVWKGYVLDHNILAPQAFTHPNISPTKVEKSKEP
jgi:hypothetical protein